MEESHLRSLQFDHGIKSLLRLVLFYKARELADFKFLNEKFPDRWKKRDDPITWPPCSPDITLLDFILWTYCKDMVYRTKVRDFIDLQPQIIEAAMQLLQICCHVLANRYVSKNMARN